MSLASPSARQLPPWTSHLVRLSWGSSTSVPFLRFAPPSVHSRRCCHRPSVCRLHPLHISFRPRGFPPPRRLAPLGGSRHIAACSGQGSLRFQVLALACPLRGPPMNDSPRSEQPSSSHPSPQRGSYPSKHSPRQQPCHITAAAALLSLSLPASLDQVQAARLRSTPGPCSADESVVRTAVASSDTPYAPMGFVPLRDATKPALQPCIRAAFEGFPRWPPAPSSTRRTGRRWWSAPRGF